MRGRIASAALTLLGGPFVPSGPARADDAADLRKLKQEIEAERAAISQERQALAAQRARIDEALLKLQDESARSAPSTPAVSAAPAAAAAPDDSKGRLEVYGFTQADAIYDWDRMDPDWTATLRPSKIPVDCPASAGCGQDGNTVLSVRQSRFGVRGFAPTRLGELKTVFEFDLFGVGDDAGETTFRLRQAYGEVGPWLAGQTWSLFMDENVFPNTIDYWGPVGMVFFRNPQLRWTALRDEHMRFAVAIEGPGAGIDTGKIDLVDPNLDVAGWTQYPDLTTQLRYASDFGHVQAAAVVRSVGYQVTGTQDGNPSGHEFGYGINLSGSLNVLGQDQILWQTVYGRGIANYMNDGGTDLAPDAPTDPNAYAVPLFGWLLYYNRTWNDQWTSSIGFSEHRERNARGQAGDAFFIGQYANVNLLYKPIPEMLVGPEFIWGRLKEKDGNAADDSRIQFSVKYDFSGQMARRLP